MPTGRENKGAKDGVTDSEEENQGDRGVEGQPCQTAPPLQVGSVDRFCCKKVTQQPELKHFSYRAATEDHKCDHEGKT